MLVITGIFDDGRFIPDSPVNIPQKKKVVVTIEEKNEDLLLQKGRSSGFTTEPVTHTAFGRLQAYANPSLIPAEQGAWEAATAEKYALR